MTMDRDELRERARRAIREAFAERPMITATVLEHEPAAIDNEKLNSDEG